MAERVEKMMEIVPEAFRDRDFSKVKQYHDQVVVLRDAVLLYLQGVGRESLTDSDSDELALLVYATGEIESISAAVGREMAPIGEIFRDENLAVSETTGALFERLYSVSREAAGSGVRALVEKDEQAARDVIVRRDAFWKLGNELLQQQAARLAQDDPQRLLKHRLQVDLLDKIRRIYGVAEHMALSVLPRGVLAAEVSA
jgi:Na+/phosphate symporter